MGADLYITKMKRKPQYCGFEVSQKAVDLGYFRDCYNSSGLFRHLSDRSGIQFSWWSFCNKPRWFNKKGNLNKKGQTELLAMIESAREKVEDKEYLEWTDLLICFLKKAIALNSSVIWSV